MLRLASCFRYAWAAPTTLCGCLLAVFLVLFGARVQVVAGVVEVYGGWLARSLSGLTRFSALALGHVLLACSVEALNALRPHEHVHVRQAERWGMLFIPAYLLAGGWQWLCGRDAYLDHPFEKEAFAVEASFNRFPSQKLSLGNKKTPV